MTCAEYAGDVAVEPRTEAQDRRSWRRPRGLQRLREPIAQQQEKRGEEAHHRMTMVRLPLTAFVVVVVRQRLSPGGRVNCWPTGPGL